MYAMRIVVDTVLELQIAFKIETNLKLDQSLTRARIIHQVINCLVLVMEQQKVVTLTCYFLYRHD